MISPGVPIPGFVDVTGVTLNATSKTLNLNATFQLTATIAPANATDKSVTWTSSNSSVATVSSDGLVTAGNTEGTAIITVTTTDGSKTATCEITVQEAPAYVEIWTGSVSNTGWSDKLFDELPTAATTVYIQFTGNSNTTVKLISGHNKQAAEFNVSTGNIASSNITPQNDQDGYRLNVPNGVTVTAIMVDKR